MRKSRFSEEQIAAILAESRAGMKTTELCRKHGITNKTLYAWRAKYGGLHGTEVKRMKEMESHISRLEKIVARQAVELQAAQEIIRGKW